MAHRSTFRPAAGLKTGRTLSGRLPEKTYASNSAGVDETRYHLRVKQVRGNMHEDRRVRRSQDLSEALELQIAATVQKARFNALALAEECGLLVAGCGNSAEIQELAALAPNLAGASRFWQGRATTASGEHRLSVVLVDTPLGKLYLCGAGGSIGSIWAELRQTGQGVTRIMS